MLCLLAAVVVGKLPSTWYGPGTVTVPIAFSGDPYDPDVNDVTVDFVSRSGTKIHRLAYFVGDGKFASTLVAPMRGKYSARFMLNGAQVAEVKDAVDVETKLPHGFIGLQGRHFAWTDGAPYFPLGYDYAWKSLPNETVAQGMAKLGASGGNWSRIWADHWDGKNPFWPYGSEKPVGRGLIQGPLQTWDGIVAAAEKAGVSFQFVLFHHGPYSTTTDSNWKDHPWNTANGGFLSDPTDFFSNPEAKRRTKIWLRYAVARYAASPAIMAWEMFNEVQWVDAIKLHPERTGDVAAWHKEMIAYVRSLDPYHHLITSSSSESLDAGIFADVDYMQPHTYPQNVFASIGGYTFPGKPGFFGEFGPPNAPASDTNRLIRDGIYGGMLAGHAGAGEYWFWDNVDKLGLASSYLAARKVIDESGLLTHLDAKPWPLTVETSTKGDLQLVAGGGWQKSTVTELDLPKVDVRALGGWSPYFQSMEGAHKDWAAPLIVKFDAAAAGSLSFGIGGTGGEGGALTVWVNDRKAFDETFNSPTSGRRGASHPPVTVDFPAGPVVVRVENHGKDWVLLRSITIPRLAPTATAHGLGDATWALVRVFGSDTSDVKLSGLGLKDGSYSVRITNAATGQTSIQRLVVSNGKFELRDLPADAILALGKR